MEPSSEGTQQSVHTAVLNAGQAGTGPAGLPVPTFQERNTVTTYLAFSQAGLSSHEGAWEGKMSFSFPTLVSLKKNSGKCIY